jgi:cell division protein FtsB
MGIVKKTSLVIVFLLVVEFLYLGGDPLSFGLPFRSVQYKSDDFGGQRPPSAGAGWPAAFRVDPILLVCDVSVAVLLVLLLVRCAPSSVLVLVAQGCVLGSAAGGVALGFEGTLPEPWFSVIGVLILFVGVPVAIYRLSLGHKRQKTAIIILACVTLPAFMRGGFTVEGMVDGGFEEISLSLGLVLRLAAMSGVLACLCFVVMALHKRVLPAIRPKRWAIVPAAAVQGDAPQIANSAKRADRRARIKRAVLYASLLAIVVYIGWHFMTIRNMRGDNSLVSDAIAVEFERLRVPFKGYSVMLPTGDSELLKAGLNVSYQVEVLVDRKTAYEAEIKKSILVPWIQVKIHKKE